MKSEYLEITAVAGGGKPKVSGVAYSGGKMRLFGWSHPVGAEVEAAELVQTGKRTVNGVEHEAPFYHVTKSTLREVSVVAVIRLSP